ncbi:NAD-dependent epimerase/dehydratase family protein [Inquilinus sp.]|uniref:NAD-dependent epimerase/dehydratase family protein n=1 Tax=Inquilinus sp. TaxID=1932117 RepID=UPI00378345E3
MTSRIFLAGASGAIGRRLVPLLRAAGHEVFGTTRDPAKAGALRRLGAAPVVVDVFDAQALSDAVAEARPEVVIHQLTDLPPGLDPARMAEAGPRNARIRSEGTRNLVAAAREAGVRRVIAQSIAWIYAPGTPPYAEDHPLNLAAEGSRKISVYGVVALETQVLHTPPLEGLVLRYGPLYGPGTGADAPPAPGAVHVDAAAQAALLAVGRGRPGLFNVAEPGGAVLVDKAMRELGWDAGFRLPG